MDEDLKKLCLVDHIQKLGLAQHFHQEIDQLLAHIYRNTTGNNSNPKETRNVAIKLFGDALAFRLLRMQGHDVKAGSFCWFLHDEEIMKHMEAHKQQFITAMYNVNGATELLFPDEQEFEEARKFAKKILQKSNNIKDGNFVISKGLQNMIKHELDTPWIARMDHLYHRKWIEENKICPVRNGNLFCRLSCLDNKKLMQLAVANYEFRQSIYVRELEELKRWSKKWKLSEMGFGREKTLYVYFAVAATNCLLTNFDSVMRLAMAKTANIIVIADDFYDEEGSLSECQTLTRAVKRWDANELTGHGKTIFDALDDLVNYIASSLYPQRGDEAVAKMRNMWHETFESWMLEKIWSLNGYTPSVDEYLRNATISVAIHAIVLPLTGFMTQTTSSQYETLVPETYHKSTRLLMVMARLLNDIQTYQREQAGGKKNLVMLHFKENPNTCIEDSIAYLNKILDLKRKEFIKLILSDSDDMPRSSKQVHLSLTKIFHMFYNSSNLFDDETVLVDEINKAIYHPIPIALEPNPDTLLKQDSESDPFWKHSPP